MSPHIVFLGQRAIKMNDNSVPPLSTAMGWSAIGSMVSLLCKFAAGVLIARELSPADFGDFSYIMWLVGFVCSTGNMGITYSTSRETAISSARGDYSKAASLTYYGFQFLGISFFLVSAIIIFLSKTYWTKNIWIIVSLLIMTSGEIFGSWAIGWFSAYLNQRLISILGILSSGIVLVGVIIIQGRASIVILLILYAISYAGNLASMINLIPSVNKLRKGVVINKEDKSRILRLGFEYGITIIGVSVLWQRFEIAYLKIFSSSIEIAKFVAISQISSIVIYSITFLTAPIAQYIARILSTEGDQYIGDRWRFLNKYMGLFSIMLSGYIIANGEVILKLFYENKYDNLEYLLVLLSVSGVIFGITSISSGLVFGIGKPRINLLSIAFTIPFVLIFAAYVVPDLGAIGAAYTRIIGFCLSLSLLLVFIGKRYGVPLKFSSFIKLVVIFVFSIVSSYISQYYIEYYVAKLIVSMVTDIGMTILLVKVIGFVDDCDRAFIESTLGTFPKFIAVPINFVYSYCIS